MSPLPHPALHASHGGVWVADAAGTRALGRGEAAMLAADTPVILLNAALVGQRLGAPDLSGLDLLELFAFVHPARFMVPTPAGLARAVDLSPPDNEAEVASFLLEAAAALLAVAEGDWPERGGAWSAARSLARARWPWANLLTARVPRPARPERRLFGQLPRWEERPPRAAPRPVTLAPAAVAERLAELTGAGAESRPDQGRYAAAAAAAFQPRAVAGAPNLVLAEAGTGIGKTLGYLAPASLWAAGAGGAVWVSTYTKALQRQLGHEARRLFPDPAERRGRVVTRKGRENYLCLLNLEDALDGGFAGRAAVLAQLVARWAAYSADGDMVGGDLPGWLPTLFRRNAAPALTDRRGECVYAGCPHWRCCFIERAARAAADADLVIANHALVLHAAARGGAGGQDGRGGLPTRYVFDEGHHLFDAADAMFAAALTGGELIELRRWVLGPDGGGRGRRRGLAARLADVASYDEAAGLAVAEAAGAALALPAEGWLRRVADGQPAGAAEALLAAVRSLVYARAVAGADEAGYGLEGELAEPGEALVAAAAGAAAALARLHRPLDTLAARLAALLAEPPDWLDATARARVEGALASLGWRAELVAGWLALLARVAGPADGRFVDWLTVDRVEGRELDMGLVRRWLDPTRPLAAAVLAPAHGVLVTSATLTGDGGGEGGEPGWHAAEARVGAAHLPAAPARFAAPSPFDYAAQAEVLVVTDVPRRGDGSALAGAYARLIEAAGGGTLGLFTAVRRLRAVHGRIADRLARAGLPLHAQHVDPIDTGTLVDIFRDDPRASLLGTDALRDGVDVPGPSLRLVVMEGVPWPKPTVLHAARRAAAVAAGERAADHDDRLVRARLAQAFGRLIRRADDRGAFVLLSAAVPSRLLAAFPAGTPVARVSLDEAAARVAARLALPPAAALGHGGGGIDGGAR